MFLKHLNGTNKKPSATKRKLCYFKNLRHLKFHLPRAVKTSIQTRWKHSKKRHLQQSLHFLNPLQFLKNKQTYQSSLRHWTAHTPAQTTIKLILHLSCALWQAHIKPSAFSAGRDLQEVGF